MRTPRAWMKDLASSLGADFTENLEVTMFSKSRGFKDSIVKRVLSLYKNSIFPPLEWFIPYRMLFNVANGCELIVDCGSKLIFSKDPYISYVENGLGLFSFNTKKINKLNVFLFEKKLKEKNFKGFVFYSETARSSTINLFNSIGLSHEFSNYDLGVIYPYARDVRRKMNTNDKKVKLFFCSSSFNLKGGREVIDAYKELSTVANIEMTVVTHLDHLESSMKNIPGVNLVEFSLSREELYNLIKEHHIVLHPTYFDTHALSLLEAIKCGLPAVCTKTFALQEYVENNVTGIVLENPYNPFDHNYAPKFKGVALQHAEFLMNNAEPSKELSTEIYHATHELILNYQNYRDNLHNSLNKDCKFSQSTILSKWNEVFKNANINNNTNV